RRLERSPVRNRIPDIHIDRSLERLAHFIAPSALRRVTGFRLGRDHRRTPAGAIHVFACSPGGTSRCMRASMPTGRAVPTRLPSSPPDHLTATQPAAHHPEGMSLRTAAAAALLTGAAKRGGTARS